MIAAVNINTVKSKRLEVGDERPFPALYFALIEWIFHLTLLHIRHIGKMIWHRCVLVPTGKSGVCDSEHIPALPVRSTENKGQYMETSRFNVLSFSIDRQGRQVKTVSQKIRM